MDKSVSKNNRKQNSECNVVEYFIYIQDSSKLTTDYLNSILLFVSIECHVFDYIWQSEAFNLRRRDIKDSKCLVHFYGKTHFGDNIEDEWFIVYILHRISEKFRDLIIQVVDDDGEFMLIETAEYLPKWLEPEHADNRVFIHHGSLHIISKSLFHTGNILEINEALNLINFSEQKTIADVKIRNCIRNKIHGFPLRIHQKKHTASCHIPSSLAFVLKSHPMVISAVVRSFYEHEKSDLKLCSSFKFFPPNNRVNKKVKMTKCLYAQLTQRSFTPNINSEYSSINPNYSEKSQILGSKLAYGAEILCAKSEFKYKKNLSNQNSFFSENDENWQSFIQKLESSGFFEGEIEGSKKHTQLKEQAKTFFFSSILPNLISEKLSEKHDSNETISNINYKDAGDVILSLLNVYNNKNIADNDDEGASDDDSWVNLCPEELEAMMNDLRSNNVNDDDDDGVLANFNLNKVNEEVKSFVHQTSGHLGVEVKKNKNVNTYKKVSYNDSDDDSESSEDIETEEDEDDNNDIDFDADNFLKAMENILILTNDTKIDKNSDSKEYKDHDTKENQPNPSVCDYMSLMDKELSKTSIGKSFEKEDVGNSRKKKEPLNIIYADNDDDDDDEGFDEKNNKSKKNESRNTNSDNEEEDDEEIDIDYNLMKNLLESFSSQEGLAGPSSTILKSLGLYLPPNKSHS